MHPLVNNLSELKNTEIESKINDLTKKYFMTQNYELQNQISTVLDMYREELSRRQSEEWKNIMETRNKGLDKLINVS